MFIVDLIELNVQLLRGTRRRQPIKTKHKMTSSAKLINIVVGVSLRNVSLVTYYTVCRNRNIDIKRENCGRINMMHLELNPQAIKQKIHNNQFN